MSWVKKIKYIKQHRPTPSNYIKNLKQTYKHGRINLRRYRPLALLGRPFIQHQALPGLVVAMRKETSRTAMCVDAEHGQDVDR
jgi:hypothetical protein